MSADLQPTRIPRSLPRGRAHLPREVVLVSQRTRLIEATLEVVGSRGYAASTVADIIRAARVSRTTFYEQFGDKEEAFLAAYESSADAEFDHVKAAVETVAAPVHALQTGVRAHLEVLAGEPAYARCALIEVLAAGRDAAASRAVVHRRYSALLAKWHQRVRAESTGIPPMPEEVFEAAVGGVADLAASRLRSGAAEQLPALAPVIVTYLLNAGAVPAGRELAAALAATRSRRR